MFYVTATDKFMSGWGCASGRINKIVIECDTMDEAIRVETNLKNRPEMKHVSIRTTQPHYNKSNVLTSQGDKTRFPIFFA